MYADSDEFVVTHIADLPDLIGTQTYIIIHYHDGHSIEGVLLDIDLHRDLVLLGYTHARHDPRTVIRNTNHKISHRLHQAKILDVTRRKNHRRYY